MPHKLITQSNPAAAAPGGFVFCSLMLLGFGTLAPCVLLPEWREYQAVRRAEQIQQERAGSMAAMVDSQRRALDRLHRDPSVMARLAQRDLHYRRVDHRPVCVEPAEVVSAAVTFDPSDVLAAVEPAYPVSLKPVEAPAWLARWLRLLPAYDYDRVFCDQETRPIIMTMSVGLIGLAFVLFGRRANAAGA